MIRPAAATLAIIFTLETAGAESQGCTQTPKLLCEDPTLGALDKEAARLADLARNDAPPAQRKDLSQSQASLLKTLAACAAAKPCLQRALLDHIHRLRVNYGSAKSKDTEGTSLGPFVATCPGLDTMIGVTFVNIDPTFAFLSWRDKSVVLTGAPAASGARYGGAFGTGQAQFWNKGKEATLDLPGKPTFSCQLQGSNE